jgi:ABC-2 type transport system ATP-binding protein
MAGSTEAASQAIAALIAAKIELADFSMGSPSLEEVFFALTGGGGRLARTGKSET